MKYLLVLALLSVSCTKQASAMLVMSDDIKLDKDQILVCPYIKKYNTLRCMSPQEFEIRSQDIE